MKRLTTIVIVLITFTLGFLSGVGYMGNINYHNLLRDMDQRDKLSDIKDQLPQPTTEPTTQE